MGNATRASRGKPHIFLTVENRVGPASRFRDSQSTAQPLRLHFGLGFYSFGLFCNLIRLNSLIIGFLFVVPLPCYLASSIPNITVRDLPFTTLGCRYPRPDFHRLDVRHARRTIKTTQVPAFFESPGTVSAGPVPCFETAAAKCPRSDGIPLRTSWRNQSRSALPPRSC